MKSNQELDPSLIRIRKYVIDEKKLEFNIFYEDILHHKGRVCIPKNEEIKKHILSVAHEMSYSLHPKVSKMYKTLKRSSWWLGMKNDVA